MRRAAGAGLLVLAACLPVWKARFAPTEVGASSCEAVLKDRAGARTARPLGSDAFLAKLERALGRRLRPGSVGRPKKPRRGPQK